MPHPFYLLTLSLAVLVAKGNARESNDAILIPALPGRSSPPTNISTTSDISPLAPRQLVCTPGQYMCDNGGCCSFFCCGSGCCGAGELCWNDDGDTTGIPQCCEMYTEHYCGDRCKPFDAECCGAEGFYCPWGWKCIGERRCCKWGTICDGTDYDFDDEDEDEEYDSDPGDYVDETSTYAPTTESTVTVTEDLPEPTSETTGGDELSSIEDVGTKEPTGSSSYMDLDSPAGSETASSGPVLTTTDSFDVSFTTEDLVVSTAASAPSDSADDVESPAGGAGNLVPQGGLFWGIIAGALAIGGRP
ncbi:hypothetical protein BJX61DRAFT_539335 [Aspergillus egyptiacus]|nr:hypothetical protein BJX61DRAFT_539335 [Aspergillus egyptiacus]